ncbi:MAG: acetoacetate decarboxylase family protein [Myxococcota bacterium]
MSEPRPQPPSYQIQGREVTLPCIVRDAASGAATFVVRSAPARALVPPEFEVVEIAPGRTLLALAIIDYRDNDLGDYDEVSITFFVRPRGAPKGVPYLGTIVDFFRQRLGSYIYKLPVNQSFTCEAGCTIWGFPKTVEKIDFDYTEDEARCRLEMDGQLVLDVTAPRGGDKEMPEREMATFTLINGVAHRTASTMAGRGFGVFGGGRFRLELGGHPIAQDLRALGLPRKPLMCVWTEHMRARFQAAEKL